VPARERNFGIVFQSYSLFPNMSVARNIGYGLECRGWPKASRQGRIDAMLALVNLADQAG
jgi:iron(III) transport system ATP-binding protein